ncbi:MAG: hypothetical protein AAF702_50155 [Chloroflexota bacterium]
MTVHFVGNGAYCYANSLAMLLSTVHDDYAPGYLECLTAVGISAVSVETPKGPVPFFSIGLPDEGISVALKNLGYEFSRAYCSPNDSPNDIHSLNELREAIASGPVLVGPLDMSQLSYITNHERLVGADHFVVIYALEDDRVHLHDPSGFAYVSLSLEHFIRAWRGASIEYRPDVYPQGPYSMWWNVRRIRKPTAAEVFRLTDQYIYQLLRRQDEQDNPNFGCDMIRLLAEQVRTGIPEYYRGQFGGFTLPLGARRCADFAQFYMPYDLERAQIKDNQGRCFGRAFLAFGQQDYEGLSTALHEIANLEEEFQQRTLQSHTE